MTAVLLARRHYVVLISLAIIFLLRLPLGAANSYWADELLSVFVYGSAHDSLAAMTSHLAENSIHPPLYQIVLFIWMGAFGDTEFATRALSNLLVTAAGLFLYATVMPAFGRLVGVLGAVGFSLLAWPMYYALEARSYALTLLLVTISSWALLRFLARHRAGRPWRSRDQLGLTAGVVLANIGLMLTHYYNGFWIVAQGIFVVIVAIAERRRFHLARTLLLLVLMGLVPVAVFFAVWGGVFLEQYGDRAESFAADGQVSLNPIQLVIGTVVRSNIALPTVGIAIVGLIMAVATLRSVARIARPRALSGDGDWVILYLAMWLAIPQVVAWVSFIVMDVERYQARYFIYSAPPIAPLLVVAIAVIVRLLLPRRALRPQLTAVAGAVALVVAIIPGGLASAMTAKDPWREIQRGVVSVVENDPDREYFILDTGFVDTPRSEYYFARFSATVRADMIVGRSEEERKNFDEVFDRIEASDVDRVIVMFLHLRSSELRELTTQFDDRFERVLTDLVDQRGFVVYTVGNLQEAAELR